MLVQYKIDALSDWMRKIKQFLFVEQPNISMRSWNSFEVEFEKHVSLISEKSEV